MNIAFIETIFIRIESFSARKYYVLYLSLSLTFLSLLVATPRYLYHFNQYRQTGENVFENVTWQTLILKSKDLLNPLTHLPPRLHEAKKVFRLTVPLITRMLGLNPQGVYILQFFIGILLIVLLYRLSNRLLDDAVASTILTFGLAFINFGRACFVDISPFFDGWAFFFIMLAMAYGNPTGIFIFSFLAAWTDERSVIALPIIMIYHHRQILRMDLQNAFKSLALTRPSIAVFACLALYLLIRFYLAFQYDLVTPHGDLNLNVMKHNLQYLQIGLWSYFEGFWLLFFIALGIGVSNRHYFFLLIVLTQTLVFFIVSMVVFDITRSGSYLVPVLFLLLAYVKHYLRTTDLRYLLLFCMFFCFIFPAYFVTGLLDLYKPIVFELVYFILNKIS